MRQLAAEVQYDGLNLSKALIVTSAVQCTFRVTS